MTPFEEAISRQESATSNECVEWTGSKNAKGYGRWGKHIAHRLLWQTLVGPIPENLVVRHSCDNPSCVNLNHLLLGTHAENCQDKIERGRQPCLSGSLNPKSILSEEDVAEIKKRLENGKRGIVEQLAKEFGVHQVTISHIRNGRTWTHV